MKALLIVLTLLSGLAQAEGKLRVLNWKDYIEPEVLEAFKAAHGVDVEYQTFTTADELEKHLTSGEPFDIIAPSHFQLTRLIDQGRLQRLDKSRLPSYRNLDPKLLGSLASFSSANSYVVPYLWTTVGLVTNKREIAQRFGVNHSNSWSLIFDPQIASKLSDCGIGWIDAPEEFFSLWLNYQGKQLNRANPRALERYGNKVLQQAADLRALNNDDYIEDLAEGRLCIAMAWAGHAISAARKRPELDYNIPQEGGLLNIDSWAIPADSRNPALAHQFIEYMLDPSIAVRNTQATGFYSPVNETLPEMRALAAADPRLISSAAARRRLYFLEELSADQKSAIDQAWARIKLSRVK